MGEKLEIVGLNAGYFLGYDGRKQKYLTSPLRSVIGDREVEIENLDRFVDEIDRLDPDIVGIVEMDTGSIRTGTDGQLEHIVKGLEKRGKKYKADADLKYRKMSALENAPILASMANGALTKEGEILFHHLDRGWKRMMIEVKRPELSVFVLHLPMYLFDRTRNKQLQHISRILDEREEFVLFGDFNIDSTEELELLEENNQASVHVPGNTYPVYSPKEPYDLFVLSEGLEMKEQEVLGLDISDHYGIRAEIEIKD